MNNITQLIQKASGKNDLKAQEDLLNAIYDELRITAQKIIKQEKSGQTIRATALAHDAWLKLFSDGSGPPFINRKYFFGCVAQTMERILVERARRRLAQKRGGDQQRVTFDTEVFGQLEDKHKDELVVEVSKVLNEIKLKDPETFEVVRMKFFLDMTMDEVADKLGVSLSTAERLYRAFKKQYKARFQELI